MDLILTSVLAIGLCIALVKAGQHVGRSYGLKARPLKGCVLSLIVAWVGGLILAPLGPLIIGAAVIAAVGGCVAAFQANKFPNTQTLLLITNQPSEVTNNWPFRICRKCLVSQKGDPKVPEIACPVCKGPFRFDAI